MSLMNVAETWNLPAILGAIAFIKNTEMRSVPAMDSTAMNSMTALKQRCDKKGITLILSHVNEQPMKAMKKSGLYKNIGADNFRPDISSAIAQAEELSKSKISQ